jgi:hypothetical protein
MEERMNRAKRIRSNQGESVRVQALLRKQASIGDVGASASASACAGGGRAARSLSISPHFHFQKRRFSSSASRCFFLEKGLDFIVIELLQPTPLLDTPE